MADLLHSDSTARVHSSEVRRVGQSGAEWGGGVVGTGLDQSEQDGAQGKQSVSMGSNKGSHDIPRQHACVNDHLSCP